MNKFLWGIQIIISSLLIVLILLQQRGSALGSAFGFEGGVYKQRGLQRKVFLLTVFLGGLFIIFSLLNLLY